MPKLTDDKQKQLLNSITIVFQNFLILDFLNNTLINDTHLLDLIFQQASINNGGEGSSSGKQGLSLTQQISINIDGKKFEMEVLPYTPQKLETSTTTETKVQIYKIRFKPISSYQIDLKPTSEFSNEEKMELTASIQDSIFLFRNNLGSRVHAFIKLGETPYILGGPDKIGLYPSHLDKLLEIHNYIQNSKTKDLKNILMALATGAGKTFIQALWLLCSELAGLQCVFAVPGNLVAQTLERFKGLLPDNLVEEKIELINSKSNASQSNQKLKALGSSSKACHIIADSKILLDQHFLTLSANKNQFLLTFDEQHIITKKEDEKYKLVELSKKHIVLSLTATPDDKTLELTGKKILMSSKAKQANKQGDLAHIEIIRAQTISDEFELAEDKVKTTKNKLKLLIADSIQPQLSNPASTVLKVLPTMVLDPKGTKDPKQMRYPAGDKILLLIGLADFEEDVININNFIQKDSHINTSIYSQGNKKDRIRVYDFFQLLEIRKDQNGNSVKNKDGYEEEIDVEEEIQQSVLEKRKKEFLDIANQNSNAPPLVVRSLHQQLKLNVCRGLINYLLSDLTGLSLYELEEWRNEKFEDLKNLITYRLREIKTKPEKEQDEELEKKRKYYLEKLTYDPQKNLKGIDKEGAGEAALAMKEIFKYLIGALDNSFERLIRNNSLEKNYENIFNIGFKNLENFAEKHRTMFMIKGMNNDQPFSDLTETPIEMYDENGFLSVKAKKRKHETPEVFDTKSLEYSYQPVTLSYEEKIADNYFLLGFVGMYISNTKNEGFDDINLSTTIQVISDSKNNLNNPETTVQAYGRLRGKTRKTPIQIIALGRIAQVCFDLCTLQTKDDYTKDYQTAIKKYKALFFQAKVNDIAHSIIQLAKENGLKIQNKNARNQFNKDVLQLFTQALREIHVYNQHRLNITKNQTRKLIAAVQHKLKQEIKHIASPHSSTFITTLLGKLLYLKAITSDWHYNFKTFLKFKRTHFSLESLGIKHNALFIKIIRSTTLSGLTEKGTNISRIKNELTRKHQELSLFMEENPQLFLKALALKEINHISRQKIIPILAMFVSPSKREEFNAVAYAYENWIILLNTFKNDFDCLGEEERDEVKVKERREVALKIIKFIPGAVHFQLKDIIDPLTAADFYSIQIENDFTKIILKDYFTNEFIEQSKIFIFERDYGEVKDTFINNIDAWVEICIDESKKQSNNDQDSSEKLILFFKQFLAQKNPKLKNLKLVSDMAGIFHQLEQDLSLLYSRALPKISDEINGVFHTLLSQCFAKFFKPEVQNKLIKKMQDYKQWPQLLYSYREKLSIFQNSEMDGSSLKEFEILIHSIVETELSFDPDISLNKRDMIQTYQEASQTITEKLKDQLIKSLKYGHLNVKSHKNINRLFKEFYAPCLVKFFEPEHQTIIFKAIQEYEKWPESLLNNKKEIQELIDLCQNQNDFQLNSKEIGNKIQIILDCLKYDEKITTETLKPRNFIKTIQTSGERLTKHFTTFNIGSFVSSIFSGTSGIGSGTLGIIKSILLEKFTHNDFIESIEPFFSFTDYEIIKKNFNDEDFVKQFILNLVQEKKIKSLNDFKQLSMQPGQNPNQFVKDLSLLFIKVFNTTHTQHSGDGKKIKTLDGSLEAAFEASEEYKNEIEQNPKLFIDKSHTNELFKDTLLNILRDEEFIHSCEPFFISDEFERFKKVLSIENNQEKFSENLAKELSKDDFDLSQLQNPEMISKMFISVFNTTFDPDHSQPLMSLDQSFGLAQKKFVIIKDSVTKTQAKEVVQNNIQGENNNSNNNSQDSDVAKEVNSLMKQALVPFLIKWISPALLTPELINNLNSFEGWPTVLLELYDEIDELRNKISSKATLDELVAVEKDAMSLISRVFFEINLEFSKEPSKNWLPINEHHLIPYFSNLEIAIKQIETDLDTNNIKNRVGNANLRTVLEKTLLDYVNEVKLLDCYFSSDFKPLSHMPSGNPRPSSSSSSSIAQSENPNQVTQQELKSRVISISQTDENEKINATIKEEAKILAKLFIIDEKNRRAFNSALDACSDLHMILPTINEEVNLDSEDINTTNYKILEITCHHLDSKNLHKKFSGILVDITQRRLKISSHFNITAKFPQLRIGIIKDYIYSGKFQKDLYYFYDKNTFDRVTCFLKNKTNRNNFIKDLQTLNELNWDIALKKLTSSIDKKIKEAKERFESYINKVEEQACKIPFYAKWFSWIPGVKKASSYDKGKKEYLYRKRKALFKYITSRAFYEELSYCCDADTLNRIKDFLKTQNNFKEFWNSITKEIQPQENTASEGSDDEHDNDVYVYGSVLDRNTTLSNRSKNNNPSTNNKSGSTSSSSRSNFDKILDIFQVELKLDEDIFKGYQNVTVSQNSSNLITHIQFSISNINNNSINPYMKARGRKAQSKANKEQSYLVSSSSTCSEQEENQMGLESKSLPERTASIIFDKIIVGQENFDIESMGNILQEAVQIVHPNSHEKIVSIKDLQKIAKQQLNFILEKDNHLHYHINLDAINRYIIKYVLNQLCHPVFKDIVNASMGFLTPFDLEYLCKILREGDENKLDKDISNEQIIRFLKLIQAGDKAALFKEFFDLHLVDLTKVKTVEELIEKSLGIRAFRALGEIFNEILNCQKAFSQMKENTYDRRISIEARLTHPSMLFHKVTQQSELGQTINSIFNNNAKCDDAGINKQIFSLQGINQSLAGANAIESSAEQDALNVLNYTVNQLENLSHLLSSSASVDTDLPEDEYILARYAQTLRDLKQLTPEDVLQENCPEDSLIPLLQYVEQPASETVKEKYNKEAETYLNATRAMLIKRKILIPEGKEPIPLAADLNRETKAIAFRYNCLLKIHSVLSDKTTRTSQQAMDDFRQMARAYPQSKQEELPQQEEIVPELAQFS